MIDLEIAPRARRDLDSILEESEASFGAVVADRYRLLLGTALRDLRMNPGRPGVRARADLPPGIFLYHVRHSRSRVSEGSRIARPRHVLVIRAVGNVLEVVRVLHDAMDLPRHIDDP